MNSDLIKKIDKIVSTIVLNQKNKEFRDIILNPTTVRETHPVKLDKASDNNEGETSWQREKYEQENSIWYDLELPIGNIQNSYKDNKRIDFIGKYNNKYVISELKYLKNGKGPGQPFDALLQLIAYSKMIKSNYKLLDKYNVHHPNARNKNFLWEDVASNHILLLRANNEYWKGIDEATPKNRAFKEIINVCKEYGLNIYLYNDTTAINI